VERGPQIRDVRVSPLGTLPEVTFYDPSDPRWVVDPMPHFDELREEAPIHRAPDGYWVLSTYADCLSVLRDRRASADSLHVDPERAPRGFAAARRADLSQSIRAGGPDPRPFLFRDPPDHGRLRGLVQRAFTPRRVAELEPFIEAEATRLLDAALAQGSCDMVGALAWPLPVAVISELLGIPGDDQEEFRATSGVLARSLDPEFLLPPDAVEARNEAIAHFGLYFSGLFESRRRGPGDDLLSALVAAHDGEDRLSHAELLSTAILLLVAGHETTVNLLSGGMLALARDEKAQAAWRWDRTLDATAPDELLRITSPVQLTGRALLEDFDVGDETIEAGSFCLLLLGGANRDPAAFDDPTNLHLDRHPNPHLGFGFGLHHCLGAPLARLEARVALRMLLERTAGFEVTDEGAVRYRPNLVLRGLERLPITLVPS